MSTRCNIKVFDKDTTVWLYHHHDGYPEGVGLALLQYLKPALNNPNRGMWVDSIVNGLIKDEDDDEYEWTTGMHGDIKYLYEIDCDNHTLKCFQVDYTGPRYEQEVSKEEIKLEKYLNVYQVCRSDKGSRDTWYLSTNNGDIYADEDGNTITFDNYSDACDKANELN